MRPRDQSNFCSKAYLQGYTWDTISEQAVGTLLNAFTPVLKYTYNCHRANWYFDFETECISMIQHVPLAITKYHCIIYLIEEKKLMKQL